MPPTTPHPSTAHFPPAAVYPAFVFAALFAFALYYVVLLPAYYVLLAVFWVPFWPLRMRQKKKDPEAYEAYRKKYWRK